jgi:hypothetical protein
MRIFERVSDLSGDRDSLINWNRSSFDAIGERRPFNQFHH